MTAAARTAHTVPAAEVQVGDRLDRWGKVRIARVHTVRGITHAQTKRTGARSPSVERWGADQLVTVYRAEVAR